MKQIKISAENGKAAIELTNTGRTTLDRMKLLAADIAAFSIGREDLKGSAKTALESVVGLEKALEIKGVDESEK